MAYDKPLKMQWIEVDGRTVPLVLPQYWSDEQDDWVVSSEQNRLPVDAQLTGSNVEDDNPLPIKQVSSVIEDTIIDEEIPAGSFKQVEPTIELPFFTIGTNTSEDTDFRCFLSWRSVQNMPFTTLDELFSIEDDFRFITEKQTSLSRRVRLRMHNDGDMTVHFTVNLYQFAN